MKALFAAALSLALSACVAVVPLTPQHTAPAQRTVLSVVAQPNTSFTKQINAFRAGQGRGPLRQSAALTRAAQAHAEDMTKRGYFSHVAQGGPNGRTLSARAKSAGCGARALAENIAEGQRDQTTVLNGWAKSPSHRGNMLNPRMTEYGLGHAGKTWVLMLSSGC
ncbi:CAP domain-containing protein [Tropicibacter sp. S64]|uniref:CAP domain-containing protein n=1 Tax=Tropicibacter sp. S64 TaxID=3415122 RepID=UPI003C7AA6D8